MCPPLPMPAGAHDNTIMT